MTDVWMDGWVDGWMDAGDSDIPFVKQKWYN